MEQFFIFVLLAGFTHAFVPVADTHCNATQMTSTCSVTVGGCVYIQVMTNASDYRLWCKKESPIGDITVFSVKKGNVTIQESFRNRTEFFINNGTLKISSVVWNDSSQYHIEVHNMKMTLVAFISFNLVVKENFFSILILVVAALCALLVLMLCCVLCMKVKHRKK